MPEKTDRPDVAQLAARELTDGAFPAKGKEAFRVYFERAIHERIAAHGAEKLSLEICGVLVGDWHRDENGPYLIVNEAIRADKAVSNAGDVKLTHDDWTAINREMDTKFADRKIVGWYHTHPNFGIFLSEFDRFIQQYTFNSPGQIAYVVDPVNGVEGVFCWRQGESKLLPHFWVGDEIHLSSQDKERKPSSAPSAAETAAGSAATAPSRHESLPPTSSLLTVLLAALCMLLLGYLVGSMRSTAEHLAMERGAVAHYGLFKGLKPGLHENLDKVQLGLAAIEHDVELLSKEHVAAIPAGDAAEEKKKQWNAVLQTLVNTFGLVQKIDQTYSLTPEEAAAVQELINQKEAEAENVAAPSKQAAKPSGSGNTVSSGSAIAPSSGSASAISSGSAPKPTAEPAIAKPASDTSAPPKSSAEKTQIPAPAKAQ